MLVDDDDDEAVTQRGQLQARDGTYAWERATAQLRVDEGGAVGAGAGEGEGEGAGAGLRFGGTASRGREAALRPGVAYRRGLARNLVLVVDCGAAMEQVDPPPSRQAFVAAQLRAWLSALFVACPLSAVCVLATGGGVCTRLCPLTAAMPPLLAALDALPDPAGLPSLQHALDMATAELRYSPQHCTREVVLLLASLSTTDPGSIHDSIDAAVAQRLTVHAIHLAAEVYIVKHMCVRSGGSHATALDAAHFHTLLSAHVAPPPLHAGAQALTALVPMGFPRSSQCPRCCAATAHTVPGQCAVCALALVRASHLARSYHHLMPLPPFPIAAAPLPADVRCGGCATPLAASAAQCPLCAGLFCFGCDAFVHAQLHVCPTCP